MEKIKVTPLVHGYILTIGKAKYAVETKEKLIEAISQYIMDPHDMEPRFNKL